MESVIEQPEKVISFSHIFKFEQCPYQYDLLYNKKIIEFKGNEYTCFGNSMDNTIRKVLEKKIEQNQIKEKFLDDFNYQINRLPENIKKEVQKLVDGTYEVDSENSRDIKRPDVVQRMLAIGPVLVNACLEELDKKFPGYEFLGAQKKFTSKIDFQTINKWVFKSITDLDILYNDIINIIDWKSCTKFWNQRKRDDEATKRQLIFYKHFYSEEFKIQKDKIKCYFALAARTADKDFIEFIEVNVNQINIDNSLKIISNVLYNIEHGKYPKKRGNCLYCDFYQSKYCPTGTGYYKQ